MTRLLPIVLCLLGAVARAQDLLVIAPDALAPALGAWRAHREAQGHTVVVRAPTDDLPGLVRDVHASSGGALRFVLLLGDARAIPCDYRQGTIIARYERDPRMANDNRLADLDGDDLPDLAVGRLPADGIEDARLLLKKTLDYERSADFGSWRRRVNVIAGVAGFSKLQDMLIEQAATRFLTANVPPAYDLHVTYANPDSPFCPPPDTIGATTLERFNEGALLVAYIGHGSRLHLDDLRHGDRSFPILDEDAAYELEARHGAPVAVFLACSTGHFDGAPDCLAEVVLRQPRGPVAVLAASRVSMPYANGVLAREILHGLFEQRTPTLGELIVGAKRRLMAPRQGDESRAFIEALALAYEPRAELRAKERAENLFLFNLLGDPALRLPHPEAASLACPPEAASGGTLAVEGESPVPGRARVELQERRHAGVARREGDGAEDYARAYARANAWTRAEAAVPVEKGRFRAELALPVLPPGAYFVRVYVEGEEGAALGACAVTVTKERR